MRRMLIVALAVHGIAPAIIVTVGTVTVRSRGIDTTEGGWRMPRLLRWCCPLSVAALSQGVGCPVRRVLFGNRSLIRGLCAT